MTPSFFVPGLARLPHFRAMVGGLGLSSYNTWLRKIKKKKAVRIEGFCAPTTVLPVLQGLSHSCNPPNNPSEVGSIFPIV